MTWLLAQPVIAAIVTGTTPTTKARGHGDKFVEDGRVSRGAVALSAPRHFALEIVEVLGRRGPAQMVARFVTYKVALVVEYLAGVDTKEINAVIAADYQAISERLQTPSLWQPASTTSIRMLGAGDGEAEFPAEIVDVVVNGQVAGKRLVITFNVEIVS